VRAQWKFLRVRDAAAAEAKCKLQGRVINADNVAAFAAKTPPKRPVTPNPAQATFDFQ
jgi:hypothetical protein